MLKRGAVIGTAGHVDHGKSTLVKRLTGIDPDRLAEEKTREMTIDLGFAWLTLLNGETVGVVDVPGHRDFIENMLAGIGGIDAVLLVIAADEGIMPQTREHLAIIDLLGIQNGLIVLTKIDSVNDPDWLDLVLQDIQQVTKNTALDQAAVVPVSAYTGAGIPLLLDKITTLVTTLPHRVDYKHPRLPIDRVFTMSGFGTVVTGTLSGGSLHVGDEIEIQPSGRRGRIRGLQSYKQQTQSVPPGCRVAVNIAGLDKQTLARGQVLTYPGQLQPSTLVDVRFRHLPDVSRPLKHNAEVKVFAGAAEAHGHVRLLGEDRLMPGAEAWLQLRLETPLALAQGDRFILRYPSPAQTIGGGIVINPNPNRRYRRFQSAVLQQLETRLIGTPAQRVAQAAEALEPVKRPTLQKLTGYHDSALDDAVQSALREGLLLALPDGAFLATISWQTTLQQMVDELVLFHQMQPLRLGISREELRSRIGLKQTTLAMLLSLQNAIISEGELLRLHTHQINFNAQQQARINMLNELLSTAPYTPPSFAEAAQITTEEVLYALIDLGEIVLVPPDIIFSKAAYAEMTAGTLALIDQDGSITAKTLRDRYNTSRKYAIALLEHLDTLGITKRVGDIRVRGRKS